MTTHILSSKSVFTVLDDALFEEIDGLNLTPEEWRKYEGNPVFAPGPEGTPDESGICAGSVVRVNGTFTCFYDARTHSDTNTGEHNRLSRPAVALSEDGITWTRPDLGLVKFRGNTHNNLLDVRHDDGAPVSPTQFHPWIEGFGGSFTGNVYHDPADPDPARRFKAAMTGTFRAKHLVDFKPFDVKGPTLRGWGTSLKRWYAPLERGHSSIYATGVSPDGLHWTVSRQPEDRPVVGRVEAGTIYRALDGTLCLIGQNGYVNDQLNSFSRVVSLYVADDEQADAWRIVDECAIAMPRNEVGLQTHVSPAITRVGNVLVGMSGVFHNAPEGPEQYFEMELVHSRDGIHWQQVLPSYAVLRRGEVDAWDGGSVRQLPEMADVGDRTLMWYHGNRHANEGGEVDAFHMGLAFVPRHRFAYLACTGKHTAQWTRKRKGSCITRQLRLEADTDLTLSLNVGNMAPGGEIRVAVLQANGAPITGFETKDCIPVREEGLAVAVRWRARNLAELGDHVVRLRFDFQGASSTRLSSPKLYEFLLHHMKASNAS